MVFYEFSLASECSFRMLSVGGVRGPLKIGLRFSNNKVLYSGDQLWYSVRGGALNASERIERHTVKTGYKIAQD